MGRFDVGSRAEESVHILQTSQANRMVERGVSRLAPFLQIDADRDQALDHLDLFVERGASGLTEEDPSSPFMSLRANRLLDQQLEDRSFAGTVGDLEQAALSRRSVEVDSACRLLRGAGRCSGQEEEGRQQGAQTGGCGGGGARPDV